MARHLLAHPEVQSRLTYVGNVLSHYDKVPDWLDACGVTAEERRWLRYVKTHSWAGNVPGQRVAFPDDVVERSFDLVLASDVLYAFGMAELVAASFDRFLAEDGEGLLADPGRPWLQEFADAARARGLGVEVDVEGETWLLSVRRT